MSFRVDRTSGEMSTILGRGGSRFNEAALNYANAFGININPKRTGAQAEAQRERMAKMREKRMENIRNSLSGDIDEDRDNMNMFSDVLFESLQKLRNMTGAEIRVSNRDGKIYYELNGKHYSNIGRIREAVRGQPAFFSPVWGVITNYNKLAHSIARAKRVAEKKWTNQDLMNRAARSSWRNILRKANDGTDYLQKGRLAAENVARRYAEKAAQVNSLRASLGLMKPLNQGMQVEQTRPSGSQPQWLAAFANSGGDLL